MVSVLCVCIIYTLCCTVLQRKVRNYAVYRNVKGVVMKKRINITLEDDVVKRVDYYANNHYTSRSGAITMLIVDATDDYTVTATKKPRKTEKAK